MKDNSPYLFGLEAENLLQMPCNCFSFTVLIGCQPYCGSLFRERLEFLYHFFLVVGNQIVWLESVLYVYPEMFLA